MNKKLFGAKALVYLKYNGEINDLSKLLSNKMQIPEIHFDTDMDPPHEVFGMSEFSGFELWLNSAVLIEDFNFEIEIRTSMEPSDFMEYQLFDLSPWFAKEISRRCKIETFVPITEDEY